MQQVGQADQALAAQQRSTHAGKHTPASHAGKHTQASHAGKHTRASRRKKHTRRQAHAVKHTPAKHTQASHNGKAHARLTPEGQT